MSTVRLVQPKFLLLLFLTAFFGVLAAGWSRTGLTDQEMLANYAKAMDYAGSFRGAGGWPWWTSFFNNGQSQAPLLGTVFGYLPLILFSPMGALAGSKAAILCFGALAGVAMFAFAKALTRSEWTALACAILYVLCPQFALRAAWNEHLVVAFCFPYPPLMCWALLRLRQRPSTGSALVLAAATAAMFLTYAKIALVFLPALILFAIWLWENGEGSGRNFWRSISKAILIFIPLGLVPLLPAFREAGGLALFEFDPLSEWKHSFSIHTALSWMDRGGWFLEGLPHPLALDKGGSYVGIVAILGTGWILVRRAEWGRLAGAAGPFRIFLAMTLLLFWFSIGPDGLLLSHWRLLDDAQGMRDWVVPLYWLVLGLPGLLMWKFWAWQRRGASLFLWGLTVLVFYTLPGFLVFEQLTRVMDIRAPWSFWQVGGSFAVAMLGGLSLAPLFEALRTRREQWGLGIVLTALALLDASAYEKEFFQPGLEAGALEDFYQAQEYLAAAPVRGSVMPISGRYFYLITPEISGRSLAMEAFQSYLMPRFTKRMLDATPGSPDLLKSYLRVAGVAYVLVEKRDPDINESAQAFFKSILKTTFENDHFLILENRDSLAPAYFAARIVLFPPGDGFEEEILSKAGTRNFLTISTDLEGKGLPGIAGRLNQAGHEKSEYQMEEEFKTAKGPSFQRVEREDEGGNPQLISLKAWSSGTGWLTVPISFHRDWKAMLNGRPIEVFRGMGGFLSVPVGDGLQKLDFIFRPPFWYLLCAWGAAMAWTLFALVAAGSVFFRKVFVRLFGEGEFSAIPFQSQIIISGARERERAMIKKALVVIPCYNEAVSIAKTVEEVLKHSEVEVLVVDDASPDGTAKIVKALPQFRRGIHLLNRSGKLGLASAYKEGFAWALERDFDAVLEIDADLSHDPADIAPLIAALNEGADLAIGSRYLDGVRVLNWPQHRLFLSVFAGVYTRFCTGLPLTDPTSGFKAIRREVLQVMNWQDFRAEGYGFQIELHMNAWRQNFVLTEVPIVFTERRAGLSKMSRQIALEAALRVVQLAFEDRRGKSK